MAKNNSKQAAAMPQPVEERGASSGVYRRARPTDMAAQLERLADVARQRMQALTGADGAFEIALADAPWLWPRALRLVHQHAVIADSARTLADEVHHGLSWQSLRSDLDAIECWAKVLDVAVTELLQEAYLTDIGVVD